MTPKLKDLDVVRITKDADGVGAGSIGTILDTPAAEECVVEFCASDGQTIAILDVSAAHLVLVEAYIPPIAS